MDETLMLLISGATGAAIIKLIDNIIQYRLNRKAKIEDNQNNKKDKIEKDIDNITECMMVIMLDRIQFLCEHYISQGHADIDARRRLHIMHEKYHDVGGNGDLDDLIQKVNELPL